MTRPAPPDQIITVFVPLRFARRGARKAIIPPADAPASRPRTDTTLIKALARAYRWKRMLDTGEFTSLAELSAREAIAPSYMTRVLRLTLLAPDIVEAILDGTQRPDITLARVLEGFPAEWEAQRQMLDCGEPHCRSENTPVGASGPL